MKFSKIIFVIFFLFWSIPILTNEASVEKIVKEEEKPVLGGTYRRPLEFSPKTLDPALSIDTYADTVGRQLFDGLVQFDKNLNVIPAIAKSWKISSDGLTYTFYLREGAKFHNGREVTAGDFVYSFTRIIDPKSKSPATHLLEKVLGVNEFQDGKTTYVEGLISLGKYIFEIKLSRPFSPFISVLGTCYFKVVPKEEIEKSLSVFARMPIGTGPFKFVSMKEGEEILLEANPDYFEGRPYLDKIIFKVFHGNPLEDIFKNFMDGKLEETRIPFKEFRDPAKLKNFYIARKPILSLRFYGMQIKTKPFDNKKVRQAIICAINKEQIDREAFQGMDSITDRIIPMGMPGSSSAKNPYPYNPKRAKELLAEAGYPAGKGIPPIEFWSASQAEMTQKELEIVKSNLENIGINIQVQFETNWKKFEEMMVSYKTPMFRYAWYADFPDPDNFLGILFHSKSKYNYMAYHNPEVDRLLDRARVERDYLKRMEIYRKVEEIVLEDAPIVPTINHLFQMAYQPYVRGIEVNALGNPYIPMKKIWLKK
ncbi:MAG: ABC transporter substrate-binding protein [Thermodesulfobacteriota bacterium]|nr:ABC transporter substrate-binding protein [Thermodesulfobacteriota bacterium]